MIEQTLNTKRKIVKILRQANQVDKRIKWWQVNHKAAVLKKAMMNDRLVPLKHSKI